MEAFVSAATVDAEGDTLLVRWEIFGEMDAPFDLGVGPTPEAVDHVHVLTVDRRQRQVRIDGVGAGRHYVSIAPHGVGGTLVVADRRVPFEGVTNFRDLGGYPTSGGGRTRWGRVFRSDALHRLTESDLDRYHSLGLHAVYDLRGDAERDLHPNPFPSTQLALLAQATQAIPTEESARAMALDSIAGERVLHKLYQGMLANAGLLLGRLLSRLSDPDALPAVFHCTGGKDRTGISAALLLELLGVPRAQVLDDYQLTSTYRRLEHQTESYQNLLTMGMAPEAAAAVLGAPRWAMAEALEILDRDYGGVESYLIGPAGMPPSTLERLRELLVA
jgi:protein-tyrosine phosphatase